MGKEIERKFLVNGDDWRSLAEGVPYRQGYLSTVRERTVRVRTVGDEGFLTIKGLTTGVSRPEYEYPIPGAEANELLTNLCEKPLIEKNRYKIARGGVTWEIDEFSGENEGLIIAEVELHDEHQSLEIPPWIGEEVSGDPRYFNSNLTKNPYRNWNKTATRGE
ncbi:MAG: CYTH domain-containing protein [Candidatus Eremiobacteraeota bacterium]|nr:CYTH domain-containing protein [Candidatus Eremiobacteraeota bacterium]